MMISAHWHDAPFEDLRQFCLTHTVGRQITTEVSDVPYSFGDYARRLVEDWLNYAVDHWEWWVSVLDPADVRPVGYGIRGGAVYDPDREWCTKFPHSHPWDGKTVVLHLDPPTAGGELVVFDDDRETIIQEVVPQKGLVTIMSDHTYHGVRAVGGIRPRVTIMGGAHKYPRSKMCGCML